MDSGSCGPSERCALQGLSQQVEEKDAQIADLKAQNADLASRPAALEAAVNSLVAGP